MGLIAELASNKEFKEVFTKVALPEPRAKRSRPTAERNTASDNDTDSDTSASKKPRRTQPTVCGWCSKPGHHISKCYGLLNTMKGMAINGGGNSNNKQQKQKPNSS